MREIRLDNMIVNKNRVDYYFHVGKDLQKYFNKNNHLFLEYNYNIEDVPLSILVIPFISNIIPLVWITDSLLKVPQVDESFYVGLEKIRNGYQKMFPKVKFKGEIIYDAIVKNEYLPEQEAASLFSGGLDAVTTYIRIKEKKPMLITEYGWYGDEKYNNEVWEADKRNAIKFANENNIKNIFIQSNYGIFINSKEIDKDYREVLDDTWWHGLHHGLAIISAAIPVAVKLKIECIYIASSNSPLFEIPCASDPSVDNFIKFASGNVFHDAYELTRQEKVKVVTDYYSQNKQTVNIRVCFKEEENCCRCEKCLRTIFGILAEGGNPRDFGFELPENFTEILINNFKKEAKSITDTFIVMYWEVIQRRAQENKKNIPNKELMNWFLDLNFNKERKKSLFKYRFYNFFPIIKRKITTKITASGY